MLSNYAACIFDRSNEIDLPDDNKHELMISEDTIVRHGLPPCNSPEMHNRYCNANR
jgi:hypothetical protein